MRVKTKIMTYHGPQTITLDVGSRVRIHPDTRGTFLPVLRDEECLVTNLQNRGTKRQPEWWAHVQGLDERPIDGVLSRADRWIEVSNLEVLEVRYSAIKRQRIPVVRGAQ